MESLVGKLFDGISEDALSEFVSLGHYVNVEEGRTLCDTNNPAAGLNVVISGKVAVEREGHQICEIGVGGFFGEGSLVRDDAPNVSVIALEASRLYLIPRDAARSYLSSNSGFGFAVIKTLMTRSMGRLEATNDLFSKNRVLTLALEERNRELKEALDRLAEAQEKLLHAERMASLGVLVAGVAHEINNPLAAVLQSVATSLERASKLQPDETSQKICKPLLRARENADRIQRIVQDLRTFARAERVKGQTADVESEIEAALNILKEQADKRDISLVARYGGVKHIEAPPTRLDQILINIIQNAIQASPDGSTVEIETCLIEADEGRAAIKIKDHGTGMPPEVKERIFDPFFTTKPVGEGTGLGLWICESIVKSLGGSIELETEPGVGTVFSVILNVPK